MDKKNLELAINLRHHLHKYPELSNEEIETKKYLIKILEENTSLEIVDRGKWFYAAYHPLVSEGSIAFRADFDAIKVLEENSLLYCSVNRGVAHKCGHDGHSATLVAFALEIDKIGANKDIYFIFQHAEETGDGAKVACELIDEKKIEEIYAFHNLPGRPLGSIGIKEGTICYASLGVEMNFIGVSSHASEPEKGKNPSYAIAKIIEQLPKLSNSENYKGIVMATIIQIDVGERAFGVSAHEGKLLLTLRAEYEEELGEFVKEIEDFAKAKSKEDGLLIDINYFDIFPETSNHKESVEKIKLIAKNNNWNINNMNAIRTSEDFGYFLKKTKGALMWIGSGENVTSLHSKDFDFNDELIEIVVNVFKKLI